MEIRLAFLQDVILVLFSAFVIFRVSQKSVFNPSIWYIALHFYAVTARLAALAGGAKSATTIGIRSDMEIFHAALAADIGLVAVVAATVLARNWRAGRPAEKRQTVYLNRSFGRWLSYGCLILGTYSLINYSFAARAFEALLSSPGPVNIGNFQQSSYPLMAAGFAVQGALIQCALHGFTRIRLLVLVVLLVLTSVGLSRTSFVLAAIMAFLIYQMRLRRNSISLPWIVLLASVGLVWFVYKPVQSAIIHGGTPADALQSVEGYISDPSLGESSLDTQFLDMQATNMAAADEAGKRFYGTTLLPLLVVPVPRFMWPGKPPLDEAAIAITSDSRPIAVVGMTPQLSGEAYMNFGWLGCAFVPFLYLFWMQSFYQKVSHIDPRSASLWVYLVFLICMIQVFRDGLMSLFLFPFVGYLPLVAWGGSSIVWSSLRRRMESFADLCIS